MTHYDEDKESFRCEHGKVRGGTSWPCEVCGRAELTQLREDFRYRLKKAEEYWGMVIKLTAQRDRLLAACKAALNYAENVASHEGAYFDYGDDLSVIRAAIAECEGKP